MRSLLLLTFLLLPVDKIDVATAGGPWSDQYCNLRTETIITKDATGNIVDTKTTEKVVCEDGAMDFLHGAKIAESCRMFTWRMPLGQETINKRSMSCKKLDGGYEIVPGYHSIK
jgi:hypothetical protein